MHVVVEWFLPKNQLELNQREISGDSYPYGLQLILQALGSATHYADPTDALNLDPVIDSLREKIADPDYIRGLARRLLLDNPHRVTLTLTPDTGLSAERAKREAERLAEIKGEMDSAAREAVARARARLAGRDATEAEAAAIHAPFMSPPQLVGNTGQYGEFVLVQSNPALGDEAKMDDFTHDSMILIKCWRRPSTPSLSCPAKGNFKDKSYY